MFGEKMQKHKVNVWLVNTGWTGGMYREGNRISLSYTRAMITAALTGKLDNVIMNREPTFGLSFPTECPGVPKNILDPQKAWQNTEAFDERRKFLAQLFLKNFERYATEVTHEIRAAGPKF
jgi:phosphoenolpyruvate carboxykinase (ATP)